MTSPVLVYLAEGIEAPLVELAVGGVDHRGISLGSVCEWLQKQDELKKFERMCQEALLYSSLSP